MAEIDDASIVSVCEFTGLDPHDDRDLVIAALKGKNGDAEAVVAAFYDNEANFRQTYLWDETSFLGDRDNTNAASGFPTFSIQGPDETGVIQGVSPSALHAAAPSRPPSRTQSPLGRVIDWTAQNSAIGPPDLHAEEDTDLQRALAESAALSGLHSPQESGIVKSEPDTSLPFFGPANREAYDTDKWAMVRAGPEDQEPSPSGRKRAPGTPAFLRNRTAGLNNSYLSSILTILHAIPGCRNAFLRYGTPSVNYGQNSEWWKGSVMLPMGEGIAPSTWPQTPEFARDFAEELHRLMAFLDGTERAYATADNLKETSPLADLRDNDLDCAFFSVFRDMPSTDVYDKFITEVATVQVTDIEHCIAKESYAILDAKIDRTQQLCNLRDLYGVMDAVYWAHLSGRSTEPYETANMAEVTKPGQVQIFRISITGPQEPLDVPGVFFPDRYLEEHRHMALKAQLRLGAIFRLLQESEAVRDKITNYIDRADGVRRDRCILSEQAVNLGLQKLWHLKAAAVWQRYNDSRNSEKESDYILADIASTELTTTEELLVARAIQAEMAVHKKKLADIEKQLAKLKREKVALNKLLDSLRSRNTVPCEAEGWAPKHRYSLRGVIASSKTFYFCKREETVDGDGSSPAPGDQWWHISYDASAAEPINIQKTTIDVARKAAFAETNRPILIYSSDAAINEAPEPLSDALRTFVRFDNRLYKQELLSESPRDKKRLPAENPTPASKRQQRSNSIDSMATNKASLGEMSDRDMDGVGIADAQYIADDAFDEGLSQGYDSGGRALGNDGGFHGSGQDSSLGTEMVQLAISQTHGGMAPAQPVPMDMSETQEAVHQAGVSGSHGDGNAQGSGTGSGSDAIRADGGNSRQNDTAMSDGAIHNGLSTTKQNAGGELEMIADWDNPEGRYANAARNTE